MGLLEGRTTRPPALGQRCGRSSLNHSVAVPVGVDYLPDLSTARAQIMKTLGLIDASDKPRHALTDVGQHQAIAAAIARDSMNALERIEVIEDVEDGASRNNGICSAINIARRCADLAHSPSSAIARLLTAFACFKGNRWRVRQHRQSLSPAWTWLSN